MKKTVVTLSQKLELKEKQISHFKQNIEDQRNLQNVIRNDLRIQGTNDAIVINQDNMDNQAKQAEEEDEN